MPSAADDLQARAAAFAVRALKFVDTLPRRPSSDVVARQLARSSTGTASNYRAARRARSRLEFIARLAVVVEEVDESVGWLEMIRQCGLATGSELESLAREAAELLAIFSTSLRTARSNQSRSSVRQILKSSNS